MTQTSETPPGMAGLAKSVPGGNFREIAPNFTPDQSEILRNPRAVAAMPRATADRRHLHLVRLPSGRRRLAVRITVLDGNSPFGRSRPFRIAEHDLPELIAHFERLEARR
jgi:hypothetical protein